MYQKFQEESYNISFQQILGQSLEDVVTALAAQLEEYEALALSELGVSPGTEPNACSRNHHFPLMPPNYDYCRIKSILEAKKLGLEDVESVYPASDMQESMYLGQEIGSESDTIYQTKGLFSIPMCYDAKALDDVWQNIIQRHQSLRTFFVEAPDTSSGRLLDAVVLRELPKSAHVVMEDLACRTTEDVRKDLAGHSLSELSRYGHRITIYNALDSDTTEALHGRRLCKIQIPHMVVDGASLCVLIDELRQGLLSASASIRELPAATQYENYISYLQRTRNQEDAALDYWIEYLDGATPCHFPIMSAPSEACSSYVSSDLSSSSGVTHAVNSMRLSVSYSDLRAFCRKHRATISNVLQGVWAVLLHTYTGESDICFGYLSSGRNIPIPGAATIVGPMMNMLVSRVDSISSLSSKDVVHKMRDDFIRALPHQALPLHKVQNVLGTGHTRLFNTIVTSHFAPTMLLDGDGADNPVKLIESYNASNFQLVLKAVYSDNDIRVRLVFSSSTLSTAAAKSVAKTFESILQNMMIASELDSEPVAMLDSISTHDRAIISEWNTSSSAGSTQTAMSSVCVHHLIVDRVRLQPLAPAICAWDGDMDYQTLDTVSSEIARQICSMGVGPKAFIPLCFEKSMWYPVALLAVLKSGNAFVPLDLSNPAARVVKMLKQLGFGDEDSRVPSLILCSLLQYSRCATYGCQVLVVDAMCELKAAISAPEPPSSKLFELPVVSPEHPAYAIFTSGSTGEPKGVIIEHASYAFAAQAHKDGLALDEKTRVLQFASYGFDTSKSEIRNSVFTRAPLKVVSHHKTDISVLFQVWRTISQL